MIINTNLKNFKKQHIKKNNQIIYHSEKFKNKFIIENLIDNFLKEKNSFVFESVDKGKIRGRYTIFGRDPDKIWEFNKNKVFYLKNVFIHHVMIIKKGYFLQNKIKMKKMNGKLNPH